MLHTKCFFFHNLENMNFFLIVLIPVNCRFVQSPIICHLTVQQSHYPVLPGSHSSTQIVAALLKSLFSQEKFLIHPFFGVRDKTRPGPGLVIKRGPGLVIKHRLMDCMYAMVIGLLSLMRF